MDSSIHSLPPDPHADVASRPRAALPGEEALMSHGPAAGPTSGPTNAPKVPAIPKRRGRTVLLATAAVLVTAVAGGAFLLSPYNTVYPLSTARLQVQARELAASAGIPLPPIVAPAAKLAAAPRPEPRPVYRNELPRATPEAQANEILGFRSNSAQTSVTDQLALRAARPGQARSESVSSLASDTVPQPIEGVEVGADPGPVRPTQLVLPVAQPVAPALPAAPPAPALNLDASVGTEVGSPLPQSLPVTPLARNFPPAPLPTPTLAAVPPAPVAPVAAVPDPVALAVAFRPAPMARGEQVEVLHTVAQLGVLVRDQRTENAALRARLQAVVDKVDAALADYERRMALAEARGALSAAMAADGDTPSATVITTVPATPPRGVRPATSGVQAVNLQMPASPTAPSVVAGSRRYKVQAASPHLAMLSELDRSGGEGSQLQVGVGDTVPGYGKITAIQQRGSSWTVQTDRGAIQ